MCEILVTKGNNYSHHFELEAYEGARNINTDGAGFVVFKREGQGLWGVEDMGIFPEKRRYNYGKAYGTKKKAGPNGEKEYENGYYDNNSVWHWYAGREPAFGPKDDEGEQTRIGFEKRKYDYELSPAEISKLSEEEQDVYYEDMYGEYGAYWEQNPGEEVEEVDTKNMRVVVYEEDKKEKKKETQPIKAGKEWESPWQDECAKKLCSLQENLTDDNLLITHFRMSTSGRNIQDNTHPVISEDYLVIHNGVFGFDKLPAGKSDTRHFVDTLTEKSKFLGITTPKKEQKLIERILKQAGGYYSIFIYSWKTKKLYYYKDEKASFYWDVSGLLGSTRQIRFPVTTFHAESFIVE